jgi:enolase
VLYSSSSLKVRRPCVAARFLFVAVRRRKWCNRMCDADFRCLAGGRKLTGRTRPEAERRKPLDDTSIAKIVGRTVWDSRGLPTVEAEVCLASGHLGRAIAPAGKSVGSAEAVDLRDGGHYLDGLGVARAVDHVNHEIAGALRGMDARDQARLDQAMIALDGTANKSRLGGNAIVAVSMAAAHAAASAAGLPLFEYLGGVNTERAQRADRTNRAAQLPLPEIQVFGGGAHAGGRVDIQDFMVVPLSARTFAQALAMTAQVYRSAGALLAASGKFCGVADEGGFWPAFDSNEEGLQKLVAAIERAGYIPSQDIGISLDIAANQFYRDGRYSLGLEKRDFDADGLGELLCSWIDRFPIVSIEDPFAEHDLDAFRRFTSAVGDRVQIVGDDCLATSARRIEAAARMGGCNAALLKPNQAGTLTETESALEAARAAGWGTIISARSGETEDVTIVHLAVGWNAGQLKVGSFARSERMAKWNEALRIEEALGGEATFAGREVLRRGAWK